MTASAVGPEVQLDPAESLAVRLLAWLPWGLRYLRTQHRPVEGASCRAWLGPALGWRRVEVLVVRESGTVRVELEDGARKTTTLGNTAPPWGELPTPLVREGQPCTLERTLEWESATEIVRVLDALPPTLGAQMSDAPPRSRLWEVLGSLQSTRGQLGTLLDALVPADRLAPSCASRTSASGVSEAVRPGLGSDPHPYPDYGPVIAKMLSDAIVVGRGRPRRDHLQEVMQGLANEPPPASDVPTPGAPYVEPLHTRGRPPWLDADLGPAPIIGVARAAEVLETTAEKVAGRIRELPDYLQPRTFDLVDHPEPVVCWKSSEVLLQWWSHAHRCSRLGVKAAWQCSEGHTAYNWAPCTRADCVMCKPRRQRRTAHRLYVRFGGDDIGHIVGTLPPQLIERVGVPQLLELRKRWRQTLEEWGRVWHGSELGLLIGTHPAGDQDPHRFMPHFDSVALLRVRSMEDGSYSTIERHRSKEELDHLRMMWAGQTLRALRLAGLSAADRQHFPNVHYRWYNADNTEQMLHVLGYMGRSFPEWSAGGWPTSLARVQTVGLAASAMVQQKAPPAGIELAEGVRMSGCGHLVDGDGVRLPEVVGGVAMGLGSLQLIASRPTPAGGAEHTVWDHKKQRVKLLIERRPRILTWRDEVAGALTQKPVICYCEGCTAEMKVVEVGAWSWIHKQYPWAVDLDELGIKLE